MNTKENNIVKKLEYLGLDLNVVPDKLKQVETLDYRPPRQYDEKNYKTYKYVNVKDIKILLTPKNRLDAITDKYSNAIPIYGCLNPREEIEIEFHTRFLKMLSGLQIEDIEELEEEQKELKNKIPFRVKFYKDYLWQIHYSEFTDKYFMLVPTEDQEHSAFFYVLRRILENKTREKIFVPICYNEYSGEYLKKHEIEEIEKSIWLFTKNWPLIYDVYDKKDNLTIHITGEAKIYENIASPYCIKLENKEDAIKFYKLLKVLFILQTELPHYYNFEIKINDKGGIDFYFNNKRFEYQTSSDFIKSEYLRIEEEVVKKAKEKNKLEEKLNEIKIENGKLELEYLNKEREIAAYLECRKTFFGKVKYFLGKKRQLSRKKATIEDKDITIIDTMQKQEEPASNYVIDSKRFYNLEELIERYRILEKEANYIKNMRIDIDAGEHKIKNMRLKIKNASIYLEQIDKHVKSIFEFWKFTNKDKIEQLTEGNAEEEQNKKLKKSFDMELDMESFSKELDKRQRDILSKEEINSIYISSTSLIKDINKIAEGNAISEDRLEEIKKEVLDKKRLLGNETFDVFGTIGTDKTRVNTLGNKSHRETARDEFKILEINKYTTTNEYQEYLNKIFNNITNSLKKTNLQNEISIYKLLEGKEEIEGHLNIFNINPINCIQDIKQNKSYTLYRINLKENMPAIGLTNIIYYDNSNQTLPLGMNVSQGVLIDKSLLNLELVKEEEIKIVKYKDKNEMSDIIIRTINVEEYDIK